MDIRRLTPTDIEPARNLFVVMSDAFGEARQPLSDAYLERLLRRSTLWIVAAFDDGDIVGGATAHTLPMTASESTELFLYDIAVSEAWQRKGVGRRLIAFLREAAVVEGIETTFVMADNEDLHALDFYRALGGQPSDVTMFTFASQR